MRPIVSTAGGHAPGRPFPSLPSDLVTIAHRGEWRAAPENSLAAIEAAVAAGADIVEIDVRRLADGSLIVMHDDILERTSDGSGLLAGKTLADLAGLRLRMGDGGPEAALTAEKIPTLAEALEAARGRIVVNADIKDSADYSAVVSFVLDMGAEDGVIFKSKVNPDAPQAGFSVLPHADRLCFMPVMRARAGRLAAAIEAVAPFSPAMIELKFADLDEVAAARAQLARHGIRLWVNTLDVSYNLDLSDSRAATDPDGVWGALLDAGVSAIQSDRVPALRAWFEETRKAVRA